MFFTDDEIIIRVPLRQQLTVTVGSNSPCIYAISRASRRLALNGAVERTRTFTPFERYHLKVVRLPIPPRPHVVRLRHAIPLADCVRGNKGSMSGGRGFSPPKYSSMKHHRWLGQVAGSNFGASCHPRDRRHDPSMHAGRSPLLGARCLWCGCGRHRAATLIHLDPQPHRGVDRTMGFE